MDYSLLNSFVHGISQVRILEWVAIFLSNGTSDPGIELLSLALAGRFFTAESPGKPIGDSYYESILKILNLKVGEFKYNHIALIYTPSHYWRGGRGRFKLSFRDTKSYISGVV